MASNNDIFQWDEAVSNTVAVPLRDLAIVDKESRERPARPPKTKFDQGKALKEWWSGKGSADDFAQTSCENAAEEEGDERDGVVGWLPPTHSSTTDFDQDKSYVIQYKNELEKIIVEISARGTVKPLQPASDNARHFNQHRQGSSRTGTFSGTLVGTLNSAGMDFDMDPVYNAYEMQIKSTSHQSLAVFKHKTEILRGLETHQVMIVEGFTGSGKTTQIPQYILEDLAKGCKCGNIVVTQPRRIAAQSVAERVCKERGWSLGDLVGYQVGLNRKTSENTRLTYMTTGVLLQTLISKKMLNDYSHIIIDEVHERDLDTDLLILVIKKLMVETGDRTTKIILMSATLNAEKFADYYPKWRFDGVKQESVIVRIPQTTFHNVCEYYVDDLERPLGDEFGYHASVAAGDICDEPKLHASMYDLTVKILDALDQFERNIAATPGRDKEVPRGGVLAFLPGLMEIDTMYKRCVEYMDKRANDAEINLNWTLIPLHSTITSEEQQKVFHPTRPGFRKIILATNIAESSITVTDITYVIDFCLTKSISCDPQTNYSCLRMEWASQDQCVQRRGRVGRVSEGYCFRMIPRKFFHQLGKETVPDMEKACLENVILSVKTLDLGSPKAIMALAIDPPALSAIKLAISNLKEVGALTIDVAGVYSAFDGDLTMMGMLMSKLPFDIRFSRLIALGHIFGVLEEAVIMACGLSVKSAFSFPFTRRLLAYMSKLMWSNETFSDCFAIINLYRTWFFKLSNGELRDYSQMRAWKKAYFVQTNVLKEIHICIDDIIRRLRNTNIIVNVNHLQKGTMSAEQALMLKIAMGGAFYPNYFVRQRPETVDYARQITRELNSGDPFNTLVYNGFPQEQPGDLYALHIAQRYEALNSVPYVKISGSKVLVQFDMRGDKVGPLSINLFRGVKMRQLRNQIQFRALRSDISHSVFQDEMWNATQHIQIPCPKLCVLPGITEKFIKVSITKVTSPDSFYVIYYNELKRFFDLLKNLNECIGRCVQMRKENVIPGSLCIAKHDNQYFRARVEYIRTDGSCAMLFLIDLGETIWRPPSECYHISDEMQSLEVHTLPLFALHCRVAGIKPPARYSGAWGEEVSATMADQFAWNNNIVVMEVYSVVDSVISCDIFGRRKEGNGNDIGLRSMLLEQQLVVESEDPKANRDNENLRRNVRLIKFKDEEIQRHNKAQCREENPPILLKPPGIFSCTHDYTLKGPFSPLEMSFRALSASAHTKAVTIEQCSVNSVALDQDPTSSTSRLLIAAGVGISQRSGSVIARETTLMPPIPGLSAMMTMIFCPMMQLRAECKSNRYTGCLSGLGKDYITKSAVYADHDMEVVFDVHFDTKDIKIINNIREIMNTVLNRGSGEIEQMRVQARQKLKSLLERPRPTVDEIYPKTEFIWKIKQKPVVVQQMVGHENYHSLRRNDVFPLHSHDPILAAPRHGHGHEN